MFSLFVSKCSICKRKAGPYRLYKKSDGKKVKLCSACSVYAERRAYTKIS